jgi:uncharacterized protein YcfJ
MHTKESIMKRAVLFTAIGVAGSIGAISAAHAQEMGRVISSTPVIQQVAVPRQVCAQQPVAVQQPNSGGGAVVGAIVGGLLGNTIGHGMGRAAATGIGAVAGAAIGDNVEGRGNYQPQMAANCTTQTSYENRTTSYNVVYEYAGKQYTVQLPYDPGPTIQLRVSPMTNNTVTPADGTQPPMAASGTPQGVILAEAPVYQQPFPMYSSYPAYPAAYPYYQPYYPPIGISLGFGYTHFSGGHHHRHWR